MYSKDQNVTQNGVRGSLSILDLIKDIGDRNQMEVENSKGGE